MASIVVEAAATLTSPLSSFGSPDLSGSRRMARTDDWWNIFGMIDKEIM
ncbi:hypothetical protein QPK87_03915 [Kamptonema cortianum]|nr:hypothetical protein [Oscillatoria laete-virens]MDK3155726.1 hypothetical protein [Kamptonema cortianum]MDL5048028.1 hypothetical protein [Oscillatoria amoena NRMC-F 0135]MDL5052510.1 hypothetical protein [Oscillatoria laete-virens NRMC-F 0139]